MEELWREHKKGCIIVIIVAVAIVLALIPFNKWDPFISSGRKISEATITDLDTSKGLMKVRLYTATGNENMYETNSFLTIKGAIPNDAYVSQKVQIGYSKEGLLKDNHQKVQVSYYKNSNVLMGFVVDKLMPFRVGSTDYEIVDCDLDGSKLVYHVAK